MGWTDPPAGAMAAFSACIPDDPRVRHRVVMGCPCVHVGGHLVAGLAGEEVFIRLGQEECHEARSRGWRSFEPIPGYPQASLVVIPAEEIRDLQVLASWLTRAIEAGLSLAPTDQRAW